MQIGEELAAMIDPSTEVFGPGDGVDGPGEQSNGGPFEVTFSKRSKNRCIVRLLHHGTGVLLTQDQGDLNSATTRDRIIKRAIESLKAKYDETLAEQEEQALKHQLDQRLMDEAAASETPAV